MSKFGSLTNHEQPVLGRWINLQRFKLAGVIGGEPEFKQTAAEAKQVYHSQRQTELKVDQFDLAYAIGSGEDVILGGLRIALSDRLQERHARLGLMATARLEEIVEQPR